MKAHKSWVNFYRQWPLNSLESEKCSQYMIPWVLVILRRMILPKSKSSVINCKENYHTIPALLMQAAQPLKSCTGTIYTGLLALQPLAVNYLKLLWGSILFLSHLSSLFIFIQFQVWQPFWNPRLWRTIMWRLSNAFKQPKFCSRTQFDRW